VLRNAIQKDAINQLLADAAAIDEWISIFNTDWQAVGPGKPVTQPP
jgi:hypothetical protein